jgi:hypothetical protein
VTAAKTPAAPGIEAILAAAKPREVVLRLCLAGDLAAEADRLTGELDRLAMFVPSSLSDIDPRTALAADLDKVIEQMRAGEVEFRFRALPRKEFSDLLAKHPPLTDTQAWNAETLQVELVALACVSPAMSLEQADALFDAVNESGRSELFTAAWAANRAETRVPFSRAVSVIPPS